MDFWPLIEKIRDAVKDNADIKAWCQSNYGSDHTVYIGYDEEDPPPSSDYPIVVVSPAEQGRSLNVDYGPMEVEIGFGLEDGTKSTSGNVVTYAGVQKILQFRKTVEDVLFSSSTDYGGAWIEEAEEIIEPVEFFPLFVSVVAYTFCNPDRFSQILVT